MPLTNSQRIALDSSIASAISNIPIFLDKWIQPQFISKYQITELKEFLYGHVIGIITNSFHNIIFISEGRLATTAETQEAEEILSRRLSEIRSKIGNEIYYNRTRR